MYSTLVFGPLYGWILCAVLMYAGVPRVAGQSAMPCEWGYSYTSKSGSSRIFRSKDIVVHADQGATRSEVRLAAGSTVGQKELRLALAHSNSLPEPTETLELELGSGQRITALRTRHESGPEADAEGTRWQCAWTYFNVEPASWAALSGAVLRSVKVHDPAGERVYAVSGSAASQFKQAIGCVNVASPNTDQVDQSGSVEVVKEATPTPVQQPAKVVRTTVSSGDVVEVPIALQGSAGEPADMTSPDVVSIAVQRLLPVPNGKVPLGVGIRSAIAVLHAFSDPMRLDTFKISTTADAVPIYYLEIIAHDGRLLYKEEVLPSGFSSTGAELDPQQLELDQLRARSLLGPWSFGRPIPMDLYAQFIERERNGFIFEVGTQEALALMEDVGAVTFSYYADPDQRRVLTYLRSTGRLVNLVPIYP